jgi:hypothetical protein
MCQDRADGTASRLRADNCSMGQRTFNVQNGSWAHPFQVPLGYPDVWFLINPSAQMLGQHLNTILAYAKRFRSGRFHEFLFTSPQLYHPYKTTAENYWLCFFSPRIQFITHIHHSTLYNLHILLFQSFNNVNVTLTFCSNTDMFKLRLQPPFTKF